MWEIIFNVFWWTLFAWTCLAPGGYAPYIMLGVNIGDVAATVYFGVERGYLEEEGDLNLSQFLLGLLGFGLLGGFYLGGLSFIPGSDAYNIAVYGVFVAVLLTFFYRFLQYSLAVFKY